MKGVRVPVPPPTEWHKDRKKYNRKKKFKKQIPTKGVD